MAVPSSNPDLLPVLNLAGLNLFAANDPIFDRAGWAVLYGLSTTSSASRIQCHVFAPSGYQYYPRLAISPSAPSYVAVEELPGEEQGDEVCRGLAFVLYKYFSDLSSTVKNSWIREALLPGLASTAPMPFSGSHAADVASRMVKLDMTEERIASMRSMHQVALPAHLDVDFILPPGSIHVMTKGDHGCDQTLETRYGKYAPLVEYLGEKTFLPSSKNPRPPSKPAIASQGSYSFSCDQKEALHRQICELVDTEERYVCKLYDLVHDIAMPFREQARDQAAGCTVDERDAVDRLFPRWLDQILDVNNKFMLACRKLLEVTEITAMKDILASRDHADTQSIIDSVGKTDATGALAFANLFLKWLPDFGFPYESYMGFHSKFREDLKYLTNESSSRLATQILSIGEQRLMSLLIEPVQRLPRYTLYIDEMVKQLPFYHPALESLLQARDLVSKICARKTTSIDSRLSTVDHLRKIVPSWPRHFNPKGRLIAAADVDELRPPFDVHQHGKAYIMLLLPGYLALVEASASSPMLASGLMAEMEKQRPFVSSNAVHDQRPPNFTFSMFAKLSSTSLVEFDNGRLIMLLPGTTSSGQISNSHKEDSMTGEGNIRTFRLGGAYSGNASCWTKDAAKARMERRFSEDERDGAKWEVRNVDATEHNLGLLTAIFEQGTTPSRRGFASTVVVVDPQIGATPIIVGENGTEIVALISPMNEGTYSLEINAWNTQSNRDVITAAQFLPVLSRRLRVILQTRMDISNPIFTACMLRHNQRFLSAMNIPVFNAEQQYSSVRSRVPPRASSPVKALSNLFSNASSSKVDLLLPSRPAFATRNRDISRMESPMKVGSLLRTWSKRDRSDENQPSRAAMNRSRSTILRPRSQDRPVPLEVFEPQLQPLREVSLNRVKRRSSLSNLTITTEDAVVSTKNSIIQLAGVESQPVPSSTVATNDGAPSKSSKSNQYHDPIAQISADLQGELANILKELNTLPIHILQENLSMDSSLGGSNGVHPNGINSTLSSIQRKVELLRGRVGDVFSDLGEQSKRDRNQSQKDKERLQQLEQENSYLTAQVVAQKSAFRDIVSKQATRPEVDIWHRRP